MPQIALPPDLAALLGLGLWNVTRVAGLSMLQLGPRRTMSSRRGPKEVGSHALHIQCPYDVASEVTLDLAVLAASKPVVTAIHLDEQRGHLTLSFDHATLFVRPDLASEDEQWRLLQPGLKTPHLVVAQGQLTRE